MAEPTERQLELEQQFFRKGAAVEVCSDEPGFRGSWFTARVVRPVTKKTRTICIEYDTLLDENDTSKKLRESVNVLNVRPPAPRERSRKFKFSEEVNAFHNDGWWEGVITGVEGDRFAVHFRRSMEQIEFGPQDMRLHREWVNGEWVPPLEEDEEEKDDDGNAAGTSGQ